MLSDIQIDVGFSLLDAALDPDSAAEGPNFMLLGIAALGASGLKILKILSPKFAKACRNSFTGDTPVATEHGLEPIAAIKIGEKVWAYDEQSGEKSLREVTHLIQGEGEKELVEIQLETGEVITATAGHPFYNPESKTWVDAKNLAAGLPLLSLLGNPVDIAHVESHVQQAKVYNLTVADDHTYYVGREGVLSHNQNILCDLSKNSAVIPTGLNKAEAAFAKKIVDYRGGLFTGVKKRAPGIDGYLDSIPVSLKERISTNPYAVLDAAKEAEKKAAKAIYSGVDLYINVPNLPMKVLIEFAKDSPLNRIGSNGIIRNITVFTKDGAFVIPGI